MGFSNSLQTHQTKIKILKTHKLLIISLDNSPEQNKNLKSFNPLFPSFSPQNLEKRNKFPIFAASFSIHQSPHPMKRIALFIVLPFLLLCHVFAASVTNEQLYQTLDSLIEHQQDIIAQKEAHISHIHEGIHGLALTPEQEYTYNMRLYDEYLAFNFDSAYYYIDRNLHLPRHPGDYQHFALSAIRMAHILAVSGLFDHAYSQLSMVCADSLTDPLRVEYYNQWSEIFLYRSEMERFTPFSGQDTDSAQYYRQLVMQIAPKDSFDYVS